MTFSEGRSTVRSDGDASRSTDAEGGGATTDQEGQALETPVNDEARTVRIRELQHRVATRDYVIDPFAVAEAMLRRTDPRKDPVLLPPVIRRRGDTPSASAPARRARRA